MPMTLPLASIKRVGRFRFQLLRERYRASQDPEERGGLIREMVQLEMALSARARGFPRLKKAVTVPAGIGPLNDPLWLSERRSE